ncbi:MAG: DNA-protecting protein DprA [Phycisphaerales bacterium]|nr:DNA-protecting protein DprA [Phycisphaerales bacterium]
MPTDATILDEGTIRAALALDRGCRSWRMAARGAGGLGALAHDARAGGSTLELLLEASDPGSGGTAVALRERLARCDPDGERASMELLGVGLVAVGDSDYPPMLAACVDAPVALWIRGAFLANDAWSVAVVGARRATAYGIEQAGRFAAGLAASEVTVVSGAARGIDAEAHRGALRAEGRTIAVVGGGLRDPYPPEHIDLLDEIVATGGAVVSECPMMAVATPDRFPSRNRIIAGLSLGTLVVEAAVRSGAILTANLACECNRLCMAVPGPVQCGRSAGCHLLIQSMQACLVENPEDVLNHLVSHATTIQGAQLLSGAGFDPPRAAARRVS